MSDADLVRLAQAGDVASLGLLLERHRAPLGALALTFLGHGPDAQDAVQDACVVALRKIRSLKEPEAAGAWLRAIVRNICLSRLRERRGEYAGIALAASLALAEPRLSLAEEAVDELALRDWVWTALARLPEALRVTAILRYFSAYSSYEDVAAILGVPVGTVKSRLNQVKSQLADALLETAGLAHDQTHLHAEAQRRFFSGAFAEFNRGHYGLLASALADDVVLEGPLPGDGRGRDVLIQRVWHVQLAAGVKLRPTTILSSKDVTVIEGVFENPANDPSHCPPATAIVCFSRNGRIRRLRQYYVPPKRTTSS